MTTEVINDVPRELLERLLDEGSRQATWAAQDELRILLATAQPAADGETPVIDLDALSWQSIKDAAGESNWIPEQYYMGDWVSDVCAFLRDRAALPAKAEGVIVGSVKQYGDMCPFGYLDPKAVAEGKVKVGDKLMVADERWLTTK